MSERRAEPPVAPTAEQPMVMPVAMPMCFNALVVESTTRCNARCAMCYQSAGPKGSDTWGRAALTGDEICQALREARAIPTLAPRFHLAGGEAFLDAEMCVELMEAAREAGYTHITTTTNAYWGYPLSRARELCTRLRQAGVTDMEISWDHWHRPYVRPAAVENVLQTCREVGISTTLRVLATRAHKLDEALGDLSQAAQDAANRITCEPVFRTGRAAREIDAAELYGAGSDLSGACHGFLNLTVNARGEVYPCCAGIDQTDRYRFGNIRERSIVDIAAAMNRSLLLRTVVFGGIAALIPYLEEAGIDVGRDYNNICHMCFSIFSNEEAVAALDARFSAMERARAMAAVQEALVLLEARAAAGAPALEVEP